MSDTLLLYVRPWNRAQMEHLARGIAGDRTRLVSASEHSSVDDAALSSKFYSALRGVQHSETTRFLSEKDATDVILRCRLLRRLPPEKARRMLVAMEIAVTEVLEEARPRLILSLAVDSYVIDVLARLCSLQGIPFVGLIPSFVKDHFRITTWGEYVPSREVGDSEIAQMLSEMLVTDYRPDFLVQSEREMRLQTWRLWWRNLPKPLWFSLLRLVSLDRLNYHYWASQKVAEQYWSVWPQGYSGLSGSDFEVLAGDRDARGIIYLPLQMSPEATIDYWSADTRWIDYEDFVLTLIRTHRDRWRFAIKEHPNLVGFRSPGFYRRLAEEPNCVMVQPSVPSNFLVERSQAVLVCTGSAGFEAAVRGKQVLSDSQPYYAPDGLLLAIATLEGDLPHPDHNLANQTALIRHLLEGVLPGRFLNNGTWSATNSEHCAWTETMATSIRSFLERGALDATPA